MVFGEVVDTSQPRLPIGMNTPIFITVLEQSGRPAPSAGSREASRQSRA